MPGKFEIKKGKGGFRFNLKAGNGKVILTSETYQTRAGAEKGIESVKSNARDESRYEEKKAKNGETYFLLKGANGKPVGRSETYESDAGRRNGMDSVKRNAGKAKVDDKT